MFYRTLCIYKLNYIKFDTSFRLQAAADMAAVPTRHTIPKEEQNPANDKHDTFPGPYRGQSRNWQS